MCLHSWSLAGGTMSEDGEPLGAGVELEKVSLREVDLEV